MNYGKKAPALWDAIKSEERSGSIIFPVDDLSV